VPIQNVPPPVITTTPPFVPNNPSVQYVYCLPPPSSTSSALPSFFSPHVTPKTLPSVTHISLLNSKSDFYAWDKGVTAFLCHLGLLGHILDSLAILDPSRPDRFPVPEPVLSASPTTAELSASKQWWDNDNVAQHVLMARLGGTPRRLLPSSNITNRTALLIYSTLTHYYGLRGWADGTELLNSLNSSTCTPGRVHEYVSKWQTGISCLRSAQFPLSIKLIISNFARGLPLTAAFNMLHADLFSRITLAGDQDVGAFIALTEAALDLEATLRAAAQAQNFHPFPPRSAAHVVVPHSNPSSSDKLELAVPALPTPPVIECPP